MLAQLRPEKILNNPGFQMEEENKINDKARGRHCVAQFLGLLNTKQIDSQNNGLGAFCDHSLSTKK